MWHSGPWGWFHPFGMFIVITIVVMFLCRFLFNGSCCDKKSLSHKSNSARELLDRRYAAGEISREEYLRIKQDIDE